MLANNSRQRIVTFRLSRDEYESVFFACQAEGARTVSEFARDSVLSRARQDGTGPQSIVKWLMAVTEQLALLSRQTAEIIPLIRGHQMAAAKSGSGDVSLLAATLPAEKESAGCEAQHPALVGHIHKKGEPCE